VRFLRFLLRFVGWLLTPLVAWAASFFGAWLMSLAARSVVDSSMGLILALAGGATGAIAATLLWIRLLRRSPELREVLQVTEEGLPVAAIEEGSNEEVPVEEGRNESKDVEESRRG
jgi:hypothetical protein